MQDKKAAANFQNKPLKQTSPRSVLSECWQLFSPFHAAKRWSKLQYEVETEIEIKRFCNLTATTGNKTTAKRVKRHY